MFCLPRNSKVGKLWLDDTLNCCRHERVSTLKKSSSVKLFLGVSHRNAIIFYNLPCIDTNLVNQITCFCFLMNFYYLRTFTSNFDI